MKRLVMTALASVGLIALAGQVEAFWNSGCGVPQIDCACPYFDGLYVGGNLGWVAENRTWTDRDGWVGTDLSGLPLTTLHRINNGVIGGLQAGYNWQCGSGLLGVEGDWNWGSLKRSYDYLTTEVVPFTFEDRTEWFGTIRGRAGIACSRLLFYATIGAAFAQFRSAWTGSNTALIISESFSTRYNLWGLATGAGAEWALSDLISIKAEALYLQFPEKTRQLVSPSGTPFRFSFDETMWLARVGVNFRIARFFCW